MIKKRSFLLVALVLFSVSLFAAPVVVTWEWMLEDPNVTTFRYQVDGEDPNEWIVVDSSVTSYTVKGLDGSQAYTLYLQQSYDGENFSGSAQAVSEPLFPAEPEFAVADAELVEEELPAPPPAVVEETTVVADAEEEVVVVEAEPVLEEAEPVVATVVETPVVEKKPKADSRFKTTITLGGTFSHMYDSISAPPAYNVNNIEFNLGLQFKNMMTLGKSFGLGMDVALAYTPYFAGTWSTAFKDVFSNFSGVMNDFTHAGTLSLAPMLNMQLGKLGVDLGGGAFATYGPEFNPTKGEFMYGAFAKLALAYQINSWFSMGVDATYNFVLNDLDAIAKFATAGLYMGFSF